jgi:hypothetical protein
MRERLDEHARFLEAQLAGLEMMIEEKSGQEPGQVNKNGTTAVTGGSNITN